MLNELRWLRSTRRPEPPRNSIHPDRFAAVRNQLLDLLVLRFQNVVDYRDELGREPPAPPPPDARVTARQPALGEFVNQSPVEPDDRE